METTLVPSADKKDYKITVKSIEAFKNQSFRVRVHVAAQIPDLSLRYKCSKFPEITMSNLATAVQSDIVIDFRWFEDAKGIRIVPIHAKTPFIKSVNSSITKFEYDSKIIEYARQAGINLNNETMKAINNQQGCWSAALQESMEKSMQKLSKDNKLTLKEYFSKVSFKVIFSN